MKKEIIIFAIVIIIFLFFIATLEPPEPKEIIINKTFLNYSNLFFNYKIIRYPTNVEIVSPLESNLIIGIVSDPWNLNFGVIPGNGSYVTRYAGITNLKEKFNKIKLKAYGNITPLVNFNKNNFVLEENTSTAVEVNLFSNYTAFGNYSGEIDVIIKVPKYNFLSVFL